MTAPRAVVVHRRTAYDELVERRATRGQAEFFLRSRGQSIDELQRAHDDTGQALATVTTAIPQDWRRALVERNDLPRFVFGPEDVVLVVGQDGLVANVAAQLERQPVIGIDPLPGRNAGVLVTHPPDDAARLLADLALGVAPVLDRTMVEAVADDGQHLTALNEVFIGQPTHASARYRLTVGGRTERQSSSGLIVGTGTGATGWCRSLQRLQAPGLALPGPADPALAWFVREPWPSPSTGADLVAGRLDDRLDGGPDDAALELRVESDTLVVFGDGMEADRLVLGWGQRLTVRRTSRTLRTVEPAGRH